MATQKAQVTVRGRFPAGTEVGLYERHGDFFASGALGKPVKTAKVSKDLEATFTGLEPGAVFWAAAEVDGEVRHAAVTAKVTQPRKQRVSPPTGAAAQAQAEGARDIVTGARSTASVRVRNVHQRPVNSSFAIQGVGEPTEGKIEEEPAPAARQEDADGIPQMSATITGSAEPTDPKAPQPGLKQEDVPKGVWQASDTELGTATILEDQPERQEDARNHKQRSATETGSAEVIEKAPRGRKATKKKPKKRTRSKATAKRKGKKK